MTDPCPPVVTERRVSHDQPSVLPETRMVWRRWYAVFFSLTGNIILWLVVKRTDSAVVLKWVCIGQLGYNSLLALFYMGGATLTDLWKLTSAVRTSRTETITSTAPPAT